MNPRLAQESPYDYARATPPDVLWVTGFYTESWITTIVGDAILPYSCKTTVSSDLLTLILPLYSMKPSFRNLFMKKFTRDRVVPIIFASVSWETFARMRSGCSFSP